MSTVSRMRDATYVVLALALCMLILLMFSLNKPRPISMLDLADFKTLPYELRMALRRVLPDPNVIRQRWDTMTPGEKQMIISHISGVIPHPRPQPVPEPMADPAPEPMPTVADPAPVESPPEPDKVEEVEGIKKGFLLGDAKKKNTKNKKKNEVVTLSSIAPGSGAPSDGFLGQDD